MKRQSSLWLLFLAVLVCFVSVLPSYGKVVVDASKEWDETEKPVDARNLICAYCGINTAREYRATVGGKIYRFCSLACAQAFQMNPQKTTGLFKKEEDEKAEEKTTASVKAVEFKPYDKTKKAKKDEKKKDKKDKKDKEEDDKKLETEEESKPEEGKPVDEGSQQEDQNKDKVSAQKSDTPAMYYS
ncbi:MAG: hypothetical protein HY582_01270 [Candidatus Omnitrophica bacterium]|nr:hypothetical protein [Candidatus Omnitrophota bacterium]